jgi:hypothetical protein
MSDSVSDETCWRDRYEELIASIDESFSTLGGLIDAETRFTSANKAVMERKMSFLLLFMISL